MADGFRGFARRRRVRNVPVCTYLQWKPQGIVHPEDNGVPPGVSLRNGAPPLLQPHLTSNMAFIRFALQFYESIQSILIYVRGILLLVIMRFHELLPSATVPHPTYSILQQVGGRYLVTTCCP